MQYERFLDERQMLYNMQSPNYSSFGIYYNRANGKYMYDICVEHEFISTT